jgi:hypothetical protein
VLPWWVYIVSLAVLIIGYRGAFGGRFGSGRPGSDGAGQTPEAPKAGSRWRPLWLGALSALLVFLLAMAAMTAIEAAAGRSLWALSGGQSQSGPSITIGGTVGSPA